MDMDGVKLLLLVLAWVLILMALLRCTMVKRFVKWLFQDWGIFEEEPIVKLTREEEKLYLLMMAAEKNGTIYLTETEDFVYNDKRYGSIMKKMRDAGMGEIALAIHKQVMDTQEDFFAWKQREQKMKESLDAAIAGEPKKELSQTASRYVSSHVKQEIWKRDKGCCVKCGASGPGANLEYDHIIPYSKGGSNGIENIQLLCQRCNRAKTNKIS